MARRQSYPYELYYGCYYRCFIYFQRADGLPVILSSNIEFALQLDEDEALGAKLYKLRRKFGSVF